MAGYSHRPRLTNGVGRAMFPPNRSIPGRMTLPSNSRASPGAGARLRGLCGLAGAAWIALAASTVQAAEPKHAIAMHGEPALPPDFTELRYANPRAPKGGRLVQGILGTF